MSHVKGRCPSLALPVVLILAIFCSALVFSKVVLAKDDSGPKAGPAGESRSIKDSFGREVFIPEEVRAVISTYPPITTIVYMLAPDSLKGWNFKPDIRNMPEKYQKLPVTGGWFGLWSGNYETMINMHPDLILYGTGGDEARSSDLAVIEEHQAKFGVIPVMGLLNLAHLEVVDESILLLGRILGAEDRARDLVTAHRQAAETVKNRVSQLAPEQRVRVYYAEGPKGLLTDPEGSRHSELIGRCGGTNVAVCQVKEGMGQTEVSIEQVLEWNPAVIICENPNFFNRVYKDPLWGQVEAVKNSRVYLTPRGPFCWFDRPPGASTILGLYWTAVRLHPEIFVDLDLQEITSNFYRKFYHYELSAAELTDLLDPPKGLSPAFLPHRPQ